MKITNKELEIIKMISRGDSNKLIAVNLNLKETTIKKHVSILLSKLNVPNRTAISTWYYNHYSNDIKSFPSISGFWLSRYSFTTSLNSGVYYQYNIEHISKQLNSLIGENILATASGPISYRHQIKLNSFKDNYYLGEWKNLNTNHFGNLMLKLSNNFYQLNGKYLGNSSKYIVASNTWQWIKILDIKSKDDFLIDSLNFDFEHIHKLYEYWFNDGYKLKYSDIFNL
ncbi:MAG: LuxR C-terminal-related transcriptional regulator [Sphaerochaetaceae bacterium]|nr:LuxR C-terminal-related transcriptional regulator [Sphaerochaetaceae bacterium]